MRNGNYLQFCRKLKWPLHADYIKIEVRNVTQQLPRLQKCVADSLLVRTFFYLKIRLVAQGDIQIAIIQASDEGWGEAPARGA